MDIKDDAQRGVDVEQSEVQRQRALQDEYRRYFYHLKETRFGEQPTDAERYLMGNGKGSALVSGKLLASLIGFRDHPLVAPNWRNRVYEEVQLAEMLCRCEQPPAVPLAGFRRPATTVYGNFYSADLNYISAFLPSRSFNLSDLSRFVSVYQLPWLPGPVMSYREWKALINYLETSPSVGGMFANLSYRHPGSLLANSRRA